MSVGSDTLYLRGRCVEALQYSGYFTAERHPKLSPGILGAVIMTQASSIRRLVLSMRGAVITGADVAILVGPTETNLGRVPL